MPMIENLFALTETINQTLAIKLLMAGFFGFLIKYTLQKTNQRWLATYHHTLTFILLPIITCGITNAINSVSSMSGISLSDTDKNNIAEYIKAAKNL